MKGSLVLFILLSGFYAGALHLVSSRLKNMENFYSNMDQVTTSIANGKTPAPALQPDKLKAAIDAYTGIF